MRSIFSIYIISWAVLKNHWHFCLILFLVNLIFAAILLGPLNFALSDAFSFNPSLRRLIDEWDYPLLTDFIREYRFSLELILDQSILMLMLFLFMQIFLTGGIVKIACSDGPRTGIGEFFDACRKLFFKYLILTLILIGLYILLAFLLFSYFAKDGFVPFEFENEKIFIFRFWIVAGLMAIGIFIISTFRDLARVRIFLKTLSFETVTGAFKDGLRLPVLSISFINTLVILLAMFIYFKFRNVLPDFSYASVIFAQFFLIFRLAYKFVRLRSFYLTHEAAFIKGHTDTVSETD